MACYENLNLQRLISKLKYRLESIDDMLSFQLDNIRNSHLIIKHPYWHSNDIAFIDAMASTGRRR